MGILIGGIMLVSGIGVLLGWDWRTTGGIVLILVGGLIFVSEIVDLVFDLQ